MDYHLPEIAEIYDAANPWSHDLEFYRSLAGSNPIDVLDLGCGTGTLCCALAEKGHRAIGVDPAAAMLEVARRKPYADRVEWMEAAAQDYRANRRFDLIVMTGHAFQVLLTDEEVEATFRNARSHLKDHGRFAFETRNPRVDWAREWDGRPPVIHRLKNGEQVSETLQVTRIQGELVSFRTLYHFADRTVITESTLRFATLPKVEVLMRRSGLRVGETLGDWDATPFDEVHSREIICIAQRS